MFLVSSVWFLPVSLPWLWGAEGAPVPPPEAKGYPAHRRPTSRGVTRAPTTRLCRLLLLYFQFQLPKIKSFAPVFSYPSHSHVSLFCPFLVFHKFILKLFLFFLCFLLCFVFHNSDDKFLPPFPAFSTFFCNFTTWLRFFSKIINTLFPPAAMQWCSKLPCMLSISMISFFVPYLYWVYFDQKAYSGVCTSFSFRVILSPPQGAQEVAPGPPELRILDLVGPAGPSQQPSVDFPNLPPDFQDDCWIKKSRRQLPGGRFVQMSPPPPPPSRTIPFTPKLIFAPSFPMISFSTFLASLIKHNACLRVCI